MTGLFPGDPVAEGVDAGDTGMLGLQGKQDPPTSPATDSAAPAATAPPAAAPDEPAELAPASPAQPDVPPPPVTGDEQLADEDPPAAAPPPPALPQQPEETQPAPGQPVPSPDGAPPATTAPPAPAPAEPADPEPAPPAPPDAPPAPMVGVEQAAVDAAPTAPPQQPEDPRPAPEQPAPPPPAPAPAPPPSQDPAAPPPASTPPVVSPPPAPAPEPPSPPAGDQPAAGEDAQPTAAATPTPAVAPAAPAPAPKKKADKPKKPPLALARKWRPKRFDDIVGQEHVVDTFLAALAAGRAHHAFLLTGTRGVGKTTIARLLAKAFNCPDRHANGEPCNKCTLCQDVDTSCNQDVIELDAASNTQVDRMRELLDNAVYAPAAAPFKVYIIDEVHMLSKHSFNAMLKTLEEPPSHVKFILATTDPHQVPVTVQSRCLRFSLRDLEPGQITARLAYVMREEGHEHEPGALEIIAERAGGSMRDALSILDQAVTGAGKLMEEAARVLVGAAGPGQVENLLGLVASGDSAALLERAREMRAAAVALDHASARLVRLVHEAQVVAVSPKLAERSPPQVLEFAKAMTPVTLQVAYEIASQGHERMGRAPDPQVAFEMVLLRLAALVGPDAAAKPPPSGGKGPPQPPRHPTQEAPPGSVPLPDDKEGWVKLIRGLGVRERPLAKACEFIERQGNTLHLQLNRENEKHLSNKIKLDDAAARLTGKDVVLDIKVTDEEVSSGGETIKEEDGEEHAKQVAQFGGSPVVQGVKEQFPAATVQGDTVAPVDPGGQGH